MRTMKTSRGRRGFSLIEVLIAMTITATLLTATMGALDASFKGYKATSESASTQVVARIVMQRLTAMIRTGEEFGPYPINPIITPNIQSNFIEFVSYRDPVNDIVRITRLERRDAPDGEGLYELWYVVTTNVAGVFDARAEAPLLTDLQDLTFDMEYEVGPKLRRVTIDLIINPNDLQDAAIATKLDTPTIRLVTSAAPRMND